MAQTISNIHVQYTVEFKKALVRLANHRYIQVTDMADALNIHPVLIYRWRKELNDGKWKKQMMPKSKGPVGPTKNDLHQKDLELKKAQTKIKQLEKQLKLRQEDIDILKKAERFFEKHRQ
jgi:transposase